MDENHEQSDSAAEESSEQVHQPVDPGRSSNEPAEGTVEPADTSEFPVPDQHEDAEPASEESVSEEPAQADSPEADDQA